MHTKRLFILICGTAIGMLLSSCHTKRQDIVIYFENDVHCAVETYSEIAAMRDSALRETPYVSVVSAGDFIQGDVVGSLSKGEYIIDIMNTVPYDVITIGNHEFDYGIAQQKRLFSRLTADVVCCNMNELQADGSDGEWLYAPYAIRQYGPVTVAFVGAATPTTFQSSTPTYFLDSLGRVMYNFHTDDSYQLIQQATDQARAEGAEYVVLLSHLGDDTPFVNSVEMIHRRIDDQKGQSDCSSTDRASLYEAAGLIARAGRKEDTRGKTSVGRLGEYACGVQRSGSAGQGFAEESAGAVARNEFE